MFSSTLLRSVRRESGTPEAPSRRNGRETKWMNTTYIELVVDGEIVDLNRIPLPADTPIVDERFKDEKSQIISR